MKKGIRCNETRFTNGEDREQIRYQFLSDDGVTPSSCTVRLGDIDPVTGEPVTNVSFFREYHRLADHQIHKNLKADRRDYTPAEKARREEAKKAFIIDFTGHWGYVPSRDDILYYLEQQEEERYNLSLSVLEDEDGNGTVDRKGELGCTDDIGGEVSAEQQALREVAASLTGRKAEVYEVMLARANGEQGRMKFVDLARKWGVSPKQITKDQEKIMERVRKRAEELRASD